jgi:iron complex outermembrane receptor protein
MKSAHSALLAGCSILALLGGYAGPAVAQNSPAPAESDTTIQTVIVTARKKAEDLLQVPVAVQALTAKDIETRDIQTLADVALFTPGLTDDQAIGGAARADRSFQIPIIRGMSPGVQTAPTTAVFINGVYVPAALVQNLIDVDNVEVLEGPQSAYFGRDTFAGAINVVTASPPKQLGGYVSIEEGTRRTQDYRISLGGPIIGDKLSFLANIDYNSHFGSYKNAEVPSQYLGSQSTLNGSLTVVARPVDNLKIKYFGQMLTDMDGPAATGVLLVDQTGAIPGQSNCTVAGSPFFCGTLPGLPSTSPAQSDIMTPALAQYLAAPGKIIPASSSVKGFGLYRRSYDSTLNVDYFLPSLGLTFSSLSGFAYDAFSELSDLSNLDSNAVGLVYGFPYSGFPYLVQQVDKDYSQEFRVSTDQSAPYRATLGASYVQSRHLSGLGGPQYGGFYTIGNPTGVITRGVFFSAAYDVTHQVTLTFDGRYQTDAIASYQFSPFEKQYSGHYYNFLPRATLQYRFIPNWMAYLTYSKGINTPEDVNSGLATLPAVDQAYFAKEGATVLVAPEKLENYELGVKGKFLDGRASLSADIYYDIWTNQIQNNSLDIYANNTLGLIDPIAPTVDLVSAVANTAKSIAKGLEVSGEIIPIEHLSVNFAGAINDTKYQSGGLCTNCASYPATTLVNTDGQYLPNASEYSATVGIEYVRPTAFLGAKNWYARLDYIYKSGFYIEEENIEKTPDTNLVNIRGGINWPTWRLEGYVNNLFNEKAYTSGFPEVNFANFPYPASNNAVNVGLPTLVTVGFRFKYNF